MSVNTLSPILDEDIKTPLEEDNNPSFETESEVNVNLATRFRKPKGSAYIHVKMKIENSSKKVEGYVCVDTGADITLCDNTYLITHFGKNALNHLTKMTKPPKLRSATGHNLEILGLLNLILYLGEYELEAQVIVYEGTSSIFLLGNDSFYGRLIYDRGLFLSFAEGNYPPIPIQYQLEKEKVKAIKTYQVAPKSHALIQVKVTDSPQLTGKEIILTSLAEENCNHPHYGCNYDSGNTQIPIRNTVATIDSLGNAPLLIQNDTEDVLTISSEVEIASVNFLSLENDEVKEVNYVLDNTPLQKEKEGWPFSALQGELKNKLPSNIEVIWDKVSGQYINLVNSKSDSLAEDIPNANYVHDKEERKQLLDGTGEGFPTPPAADSVHPDEDNTEDPEAWLSNIEHAHLTDEEWSKLRKVILDHSNAFSKSKTEIGCCNYFRVALPLKPGTGFLYNKPRPLPFKHREIAAETISELLAKGVIRPSNSPHATNVVVVKKKIMNGVVSHRMCVDLRQVNEHSVPNRFPNYWIEDAMEKFNGSIFRTAFDFKDAFHQLVLTEDSIPVTAFYFNNVLFEYVRVPFGHVCAMNAYCCLMALLCIGYDPASYYADDLMITTKLDCKMTKEQQFDQHLEHIAGMLKRIVDANLRLVAHKCQWAYSADKPMEWLGFTLENNLLKPQESKVEAIKNFPVPKSAKQVISFISTASFYRRFIKSFAKEVQPMYNVANKEPFEWNEEAQKSFDRLKEIMCSDLVLRLPRQGEPFQLYSDASAGAIGVVLCQIDPIDKKSHPCAFGSRKFNDCEMKLSIPCKELLAIVYGLNLWSYYICGNPIQVFSDCRAWTFLKVQCGASGKISRLALLVSEYDISISYVKGTQNKAADGLSRAFDDGTVKYDDQLTARHPALNELGAPKLEDGEVMKLNEYLDKCDEYLSTEWPPILAKFEKEQAEMKHPATSSKSKERKKERLNETEKSTLNESEIVNKTIRESVILHIDRIRIADWTKRLGLDGVYPFKTIEDSISVDTNSTVIEEDLPSDIADAVTLSDTESSDSDETETTDSSVRVASFNVRLIAINESCFSLQAFAALQRQDDFCSEKIDLVKRKDTRTLNTGYFLKRNILMRQMSTRDSQTFNVICVPRVLVKPLLESSHRTLLSGHFGSQRYFLNLSRKYYWPRMKDEVIDFHHHCIPCQYNDKYPIKYLSGHVIRPAWPMHIVHCDLVVGLPRALDGSHAILLLYDGFSRFTFGIPLSSEKAEYVVNKLMSHFVAAFGLPWALHSDNGRNVDGAFIRHLARMLGVLKTSTPPHTPNANPTETMCGAVSMLLRKALNESDKRYWSLCLPFVLNALNSTVHTATGYTPNSLFFGRYRERDLVPLIPFDDESANVNEYFQKMRRFQELAFQIVRSRNERKLIARKAQWDTTARTHSYKEGDFVLVKNKNPASGPGKKKLRSVYVGPFRVIKAYTSSLIVVPWTENSRLEEYYKDPDIFRLIHRGDIKPFYTRQVSVKYCKPFRGKIETEEIVDPIMLTRFLDALGIDSKDDLISEIDRTPMDGGSIDTWSTDNSSDPDDHGPGPPPDDPDDPGPPSGPPSSGGSSGGPPGGPPGGPGGPNPPPPPNPPNSPVPPDPPNDPGNNDNPNAPRPFELDFRDTPVRNRDLNETLDMIWATPFPNRMPRHQLERNIDEIQGLARDIRRQITDLEYLADHALPDVRERAREDLDRAVSNFRKCREKGNELREVEIISSDEEDPQTVRINTDPQDVISEPKKRVVEGRTLDREFQEHLDDEVYDNSDLSHSVKTRLREYRRHQEDLVDMSLDIASHDQNIERLERMMASDDPTERRVAQNQLRRLNQRIDRDLERFRADIDDLQTETNQEETVGEVPPDDNASQHSDGTGSMHTPGSPPLSDNNDDDVADFGPTEEEPTATAEPIAGPSHTIRIRAPNIEIDVGPTNPLRFGTSRASSLLTRGTKKNIDKWLSSSASFFPSRREFISKGCKRTIKGKSVTGDTVVPEDTARTTRSGRQVKAPIRYDDYLMYGKKSERSKSVKSRKSDTTKKSTEKDKTSSSGGAEKQESDESVKEPDSNQPE